MKKLTILLLIAICHISCNSQEQSGVLIEGTITNNSVKSIAVGDSLLQLGETGTFLFRRATAKPQFLTIKYREREFEIFVEPGEHLEILFDSDDIDNSIAFKGLSPETNMFLFRQSQINDQVSNFLKSNHVSLFSSDEPVFMHVLDSLKRLYQERLDELTKENKINERFVFETKNSVNFSLDGLIIDYPRLHNRYTGNAIIYSKKTQTYLDSINLDDPDLIDVYGYSEFGEGFMHMKVRNEFRTNKGLRKLDNQWLHASFNIIDQLFKNKKVIDYWQFHYIDGHIEKNGIKNLEGLLAAFNRTCLSEELKARLNSFYEKELGNRKGHLVKTYKTIDGFELDAHIFLPNSLKEGEKRPAIVRFHGGSWSEGKPDWFFGYSELGFINICVEYRTYDRHGVLPFEEISDAKSVIRWLRENSDELHIDENQIVASGNSAGGHLALCAAILNELDEPNENSLVSSKPNALILNAAIYELEGLWFESLVNDKKRIKDISPIHIIRDSLPPMLVFHGTADSYSSPYWTCEKFVEEAKSAGNDVYFYPIEGVGHSLWSSGKYWQVSGKAKRDFFRKLGYL